MINQAELSGPSDDSFSAVSTQAHTPEISVTGYVAGTLIRLVQGDTPIEALRIGDCVVTASGEERAIRWVGTCQLPCLDRKDTMPVRIAAHAFADGRPARNLYVAPTHGICVDALGEVFIPAKALINGSTVAQDQCDEICYWHIELESHDVLLAENLAGESFIDIGNRVLFKSADDREPDFNSSFDVVGADHRESSVRCRPFYSSGPIPDAIRLILQSRARNLLPDWRLDKAPLANLHLLVDGHVVQPSVEGLSARFLVSTQARDVRLMSTTVVPADVVDGSSDRRVLGVSLSELVIDDGLTGLRRIELSDARLSTGFHPPEFVEQTVYWRWTDGAAVLPYSLWEGCREMFFLRVTLAEPALPRWLRQDETGSGSDLDMDA